jgi:hypothetical protein
MLKQITQQNGFPTWNIPVSCLYYVQTSAIDKNRQVVMIQVGELEVVRLFTEGFSWVATI